MLFLFCCCSLLSSWYSAVALLLFYCFCCIGCFDRHRKLTSLADVCLSLCRPFSHPQCHVWNGQTNERNTPSFFWVTKTKTKQRSTLRTELDAAKSRERELVRELSVRFHNSAPELDLFLDVSKGDIILGDDDGGDEEEEDDSLDLTPDEILAMPKAVSRWSKPRKSCEAKVADQGFQGHSMKKR